MSQLLHRLEQGVHLAVDPVARGVLQAQIAGYLARVGRFDDAQFVTTEVRRDFGDGRSSRVSAWVMWAEALRHYYLNLAPESLDRVTRAQLIATTTRDRELAALASAWKAHFEFETSRFEAMLGSIRTALLWISDENHGAQSRLAIVISNALLLCGDRESAQQWFLRGRDHALRDGDQASVEALIYNRCAFRLAWLRAYNCVSKIEPDEVALLRSEIESSKNYQGLTGVDALTNIVLLCDARTSVLEEKYASAIEKYRAVRGRGPFASYNFSESLIDLEIAYCSAKLGDLSSAAALLVNIEVASFSQLDLDERLVAAWMRHQLASLGLHLGDWSEAERDFSMLSVEHSEFVDGLRTRIKQLQPAT